MKLRLFPLATALVLIWAACGPDPTATKAEVLTQDENDRLNKAADKLNQDEPPPRLTQGELPKAPAPPANR